MSKRRILVISALALVAALTVSALDIAGPYAYVRICNLYRDYVNQVGKPTQANPNLVFLAIDAASLNPDRTDIDENSKEGNALRLMGERFPWSREVYGLILERLVQAGARVVTFDLTFPVSSDDDPAFRTALDRYADHVVIASNFVDGDQSERTLTRPTETLISQTRPIDSRIGFANFFADEDEVVRRARYRSTFEQVRELPDRPDGERFSSLAAVALTKAGFGADVPDDQDDHAIRFTGAPRQGFPPHSLYEIFVPDIWKQNYQSGQFFRDKIVLVGAEGNWQHDYLTTPVGSMPGPEMHLNAMNAAIHHEFIRELSPALRLVCCLAAGLIAIGLSLILRLPWIRFVTTIGLSAAAVGLSLLLFNYFAVFLPIIAPLIVMNATMLLALVCDFTFELLEKARLRRTLERYVSRDVVHEMIDHPKEYGDTLGGVVRPAAILFSDIRSYSTVVSRSAPQILITQLNEYFTAMVDCVFVYGGTLDKFIGDALMAVWGTLHSQGAQQDAISAVRAALRMREKLSELNLIWQERGWPELRVGMGINYGDVVAGNIGSPQRMEFTVIGDAVNFSWRLQEMTKRHSTSIILSSSVALLVADHFKLNPLTDGKAGPIQEAYQIYEPDRDLAPALVPSIGLPEEATAAILAKT